MGRRGILSSLGAGLSLVIAGVIALAVVSGVVAYRGWPGMRATPPADDVTMPAVVAARTAAADTGQPVVLGSGAPGAARRERSGASGAPRGTDRRRPSARRGDRTRERAGRSPGARDGDRTVAAGEPGAPPSTGDGAAQPAGGGAAGSGDGRDAPAPAPAPDPVARAVEGVDRIVDDVTPPSEPGAPPVDVPGAVQDTTQTVDEVVEDTAATVEGVADGATGPVDGLLP